ncbi:MAG: hypothetical protein ACFB2Z_14870 [Maricaulaceae bacterium]
MFEGAFEDELTQACASGRANAALRLMFDTRAALNAQTRVDRLIADALGGAFLDAHPTTPVQASADAVLAAIDAALEGDDDHISAALNAGGDLQTLLNFPEPLRGAALAAAEQGESLAPAGPGIRRMTVMTDGAMKAEILYIEAGRATPTHSHRGKEYTLVLEGGFIAGGAHFGPGEVCVVGEETTHQPKADPDHACVVLAVTDAPLAFSGMLGMVQKLFPNKF